MFTRKLSTTLVITLALIATSTVVEASHDLPLQQRNHVDHVNRMIRKRSPQDLLPPAVVGAAPIPGASTTATDVVSTTTSATSAAATSPASSATTTTSGSVSTTTSGTESATTSTTGSGSQSTTTTSTTQSATPTTAATTAAPQQPAETTPAPAGTVVQTQVDKVKSTKTVVTSVEASATVLPQLTGAAKVGSNVVTVLIAIVASIGGVLILWTIFRKWKLGSSKKFEDRMNPIDWRPESNENSGLPTRRLSSASSYRSGPSSARSPDPLEHDFTAGPSHVSPVGGYADMSRGPSPTMRENRGYDYSVPIHSGGRY